MMRDDGMARALFPGRTDGVGTSIQPDRNTPAHLTHPQTPRHRATRRLRRSPALRPYRSQNVQDAAQQAVDSGTDARAAIVEAAVLRAALAALKAGRLADKVAAPATADATGRSDLRADTQWLLRIADAYSNRHPVHVTDGGQPEPAGA